MPHLPFSTGETVDISSGLHIDGVKVDLKTAQQAVAARLFVLFKRIRQQPTQRQAERVILGTWTQADLAFILSVITSGQDERAQPRMDSQSALRAIAEVKALLRSAMRDPEEPLRIPGSELFVEKERVAQRAVVVENTERIMAMRRLCVAVDDPGFIDVKARKCVDELRLMERN